MTLGGNGAKDVLEKLRECREREKAQTLFYRALAAEAELQGASDTAERLNGLHADEQHHLSRVTARILELGAEPADLSELESSVVPLAKWEVEARRREEQEVTWYQQLLAGELDPVTRGILREILESEEHHRQELGGKWMPA